MIMKLSKKQGGMMAPKTLWTILSEAEEVVIQGDFVVARQRR